MKLEMFIFSESGSSKSISVDLISTRFNKENNKASKALLIKYIGSGLDISSAVFKIIKNLVIILWKQKKNLKLGKENVLK